MITKLKNALAKRKNGAEKPKKEKKVKVPKATQIACYLEQKSIVDILLKATSLKATFFTNFMGGVARGIGFTIGASLILVVLFRLLVMITKLNIPYIQDVVQDMVNVIATSPAVEKIIAQEQQRTPAPEVETTPEE